MWNVQNLYELKYDANGICGMDITIFLIIIGINHHYACVTVFFSYFKGTIRFLHTLHSTSIPIFCMVLVTVEQTTQVARFYMSLLQLGVLKSEHGWEMTSIIKCEMRYLPMLGLKLIHVSKRGRRSVCEMDISHDVLAPAVATSS